MTEEEISDFKLQISDFRIRILNFGFRISDFERRTGRRTTRFSPRMRMGLMRSAEPMVQLSDSTGGHESNRRQRRKRRRKKEAPLTNIQFFLDHEKHERHENGWKRTAVDFGALESVDKSAAASAGEASSVGYPIHRYSKAESKASAVSIMTDAAFKSGSG